MSKHSEGGSSTHWYTVVLYKHYFLKTLIAMCKPMGALKYIQFILVQASFHPCFCMKIFWFLGSWFDWEWALSWVVRYYGTNADKEQI